MIERFKNWNEWRKHCLNGKMHKFLVLVGFRKSVTFTAHCKWKNFMKNFMEGFELGFAEAENMSGAFSNEEHVPSVKIEEREKENG